MEDWAHNLLFDTTEIHKERGVLVEEWRLGRGPFQRMEDKYIPVLFNGSRYAERLPIGKKEIIEGAGYRTITEILYRLVPTRSDGIYCCRGYRCLWQQKKPFRKCLDVYR